MSGHGPASITLAAVLNQLECLNSSGVCDSNSRPEGICVAAAAAVT